MRRNGFPVKTKGENLRQPMKIAVLERGCVPQRSGQPQHARDQRQVAKTRRRKEKTLAA